MIIAKFPVVNILILSDDMLIRWVLHEICARDGHEISMASDAGCAARLGEGTSYDLVFVDQDIEDTEAASVVRDILHRQPQASCVLLSSGQAQEPWPAIRNASVSGMIAKPFDASMVRLFLQKVNEKRVDS